MPGKKIFAFSFALVVLLLSCTALYAQDKKYIPLGRSKLKDTIAAVSADTADEKDIVDIVDESGVLLGRGVSRFDSKKLIEEVEKFKNSTDLEKAKMKTSKMIAVHYDYFVYC